MLIMYRQLSGVVATALVIGLCCAAVSAAEPVQLQGRSSPVQERLADAQSLCQRIERPMKAALASQSGLTAKRAQQRMEKVERLLEQAELTLEARPNLSELAIHRAQREMAAVVASLRLTPEPEKEDRR